MGANLKGFNNEAYKTWGACNNMPRLARNQSIIKKSRILRDYGRGYQKGDYNINNL